MLFYGSIHIGTASGRSGQGRPRDFQAILGFLIMYIKFNLLNTESARAVPVWIDPKSQINIREKSRGKFH